jgi:hypothetical protein
MGQLKVPLGKWTNLSDQIQQKCKTHLKSQHVYYKDNRVIRKFKHDKSAVAQEYEKVNEFPIKAFPI